MNKRKDGSSKVTQKIHLLFNMLLKQELPFRLEGNVLCSSQPMFNSCCIIRRGEISAFAM